mgnify:CR=1 FL=1
MTATTSPTQGVHHLGLTVPDLSASLRFFTDALGYKKVGERPDSPAAFVTDGHTMLSIWQAKTASRATPFDRHHHLGLHHFALLTTALDELYHQLSQRQDTVIEFAPQPVGNGPARHMMCHIPGGLRLELIQP